MRNKLSKDTKAQIEAARKKAQEDQNSFSNQVRSLLGVSKDSTMDKIKENEKRKKRSK